MSEPSKLAVSVNIGQGRRNSVGKMLTLDRIIEYIYRQELDEYTTKGLIEEASKYPHQALPSFRRNINVMIQRVRARRKVEQQGMESNGKLEEKPKIVRQSISLDEAINYKPEEANISTQEETDYAGIDDFK